MVVLIDSPGFQVLNRSRLLKSADVSVVAEACDLLRRAHERDKLMLQQTTIAYEQARQSGWQNGLNEANALMATRLATAAAAKQLALVDLSPTLVNIVSEALSLLLKDADRSQLLSSSFDAVSGLLKKAQWAELRVHPSQVDMARNVLSQSSVSRTALALVTVVANATLKPDDCIFETDVGIADASLSVQLQTIITAFESSISSLVQKAGLDQETPIPQEVLQDTTTDSPT